MSEEKKINDQQESGSPEQLSLNDDRRVKVLSRHAGRQALFPQPPRGRGV